MTIRIGIVEKVSAAGAKVIVTVQEKSKEVSKLQSMTKEEEKEAQAENRERSHTD